MKQSHSPSSEPGDMCRKISVLNICSLYSEKGGLCLSVSWQNLSSQGDDIETFFPPFAL